MVVGERPSINMDSQSHYRCLYWAWGQPVLLKLFHNQRCCGTDVFNLRPFGWNIQFHTDVVVIDKNFNTGQIQPLCHFPSRSRRCVSTTNSDRICSGVTDRRSIKAYSSRCSARKSRTAGCAPPAKTIRAPGCRRVNPTAAPSVSKSAVVWHRIRSIGDNFLIAYYSWAD